MKIICAISGLMIALSISFSVSAQSGTSVPIHFNFYGDSICLPYNSSAHVEWKAPLSDSSIRLFYAAMEKTDYAPMIKALLGYRESYKLDDWLYYQLIRKTAHSISPKAENYVRYTLYKWFLLAKS